VSFGAEEEKSKTADAKYFWHAQISESLMPHAAQTKFISTGSRKSEPDWH
jgi:hypothetical protein